MYKYEEKIIPERKEEHISSMICDFCGKESNKNDWPTNESNRNIYERTKITIKKEKTENYPGAMNYRITEYHLCPNCFEKLENWMQENGANPTYEEEC